MVRPFLVLTQGNKQSHRILWDIHNHVSVPVTARSEAWVYGRSPAAIVGSNSTGGMDVFLLCVLCVVRERSLRRDDHSSRGILPTVVLRCV
jgi:hypothetical protein